MKIYSQDNGVYGLIVVVAENKEAAAELIRQNSMYEKLSDKPIEEKEIVNGLVIANWGDS